MPVSNNLRPVTVTDNGKKVNGFFHRYVYSMSGNYSETKVLVELFDGRLRFYDPYFVQFSDRQKNEGNTTSTKHHEK